MADFDATFGGHPFTLRLSINVTSQNIVGNYSSLSWSLTAIKTGNFTPFRSDSAATWSFNRAGSGNWGPYSFNGGVGQTITVASGSFTAGHNPDGTLTLSLAWSADAKSTITTASGSASMTLPTIPQAPSAPTVGAFTQTSSTSAALTWTAPASNGESAITAYRAQIATGAAFSGATSFDGTALSHSFTGLTPGVRYYARVAALNAATAAGAALAWSATASVTIIAEIGDLDGWSSFGALPEDITPLVDGALRRTSDGLIRETTGSGTGTLEAGSIGIQRTMTVTPGSLYALDGTIAAQTALPAAVSYRWAIDGTDGDESTMTDLTPVPLPTLSFTATAPSIIVRLELAEDANWTDGQSVEDVILSGLTLTEILDPSPYKERDIAYEGPLSTHFGYACDTVGAAWWIDRNNVTRFRRATSQDAIVATFTDVREPGALEYTDIAASLDTRNLVNSLSGTNHGYDPDTGNAADDSFSATNNVSVAAWGPRSGSIDLALYDPDGVLLPVRVTEILDAYGTPNAFISSLTWNAQSDTLTAARLDIQDRIRVKFDGLSQDSRIVGIKHTVTGERWMMTLTLSPS